MQFFQAFYGFIAAFLKNRRPLGSCTAYSLIQRGRIFCLEMTANRNILRENGSMEYISKTMQSCVIEPITLNTSIVLKPGEMKRRWSGLRCEQTRWILCSPSLRSSQTWYAFSFNYIDNYPLMEHVLPDQCLDQVSIITQPETRKLQGTFHMSWCTLHSVRSEQESNKGGAARKHVMSSHGQDCEQTKYALVRSL